MTSSCEPPKKRSRPTVGDGGGISAVCCLCTEENLPYLLLVGCSNMHTVCHVCARMFVSSKITMNPFPRYFPGKISRFGELDCPLCREPISGLTNMFVSEEPADAKTTFDCPYLELLDTEHAECSKPLTFRELHQHLIAAHNHTIKCPNCLEWLCDPEKTIEDVLLFHVMKQCQKVRCHGCDRTGNMMNMYMHSLIGRDSVCESASELFHAFGLGLAECAFLFNDAEDMTHMAISMLRSTMLYLYTRTGAKDAARANDRHFRVVFNALIPQLFCAVHAPLIDADFDNAQQNMVDRFRDLSKTPSGEYEETVMLCVSAFAQRHRLRLDSVSQLPFFYRILVMSMSDSRYAQTLFRRCPKTLTAPEQTTMETLIHFYQRLIHGAAASSSVSPQENLPLEPAAAGRS